MIIKDLQRYIDHTNLKPEANFNDIVKLCEEAKKYGFAAVCINPCFVQTAKKELNGSGVKVCTVIGFPLGACHTSVKVFEAETAVLQGADEIDMVINIGWLKSGQIDFLTNEIKEVVQGVKGKAIVKVIIECCLLTNYEKVVACNASLNGGADYVKTSTGFSVGGATVEDVILMKEAVGNKMKVKAAGGIRDINVAAKMIDAGADRIGTSVGVKLIEESNNGMEC